MEVVARKDYLDNYVYTLIEGSAFLKIYMTCNQDLYWVFDDMHTDFGYDYGVFNITKDNKFIYNLFDELYNNISNANPYEIMATSMTNPVGEITSYIFDVEKLYMYLDLFDGEHITWISDDRYYDKNLSVRISKQEDKYVLEFIKQKKDGIDNYYEPYRTCATTIRFSGNDSHYAPFNKMFARMYRDFGGYDSTYGQMPYKRIGEIQGQEHIEDYIYSLRKK